MLTIGKLAKRAKVSTDTIRFYERLELLAPTSKTSSGYRLYAENTLERLSFIHHAQRCGFSLSEIRELMRPRQGESLHAYQAYLIAIEKKLKLEQTMIELQAMDAALSAFIGTCADHESAMQGALSNESALIGALSARLAEQRRPERPSA